MNPAITTSGLSKSYGELKAVDDLNLSVPRGQLFALLGVNGAGKTTAIKMLCGLIRPTSGTAQLAGIDVTAEPLRVKALTGLSPQETAVAMQLSVRENLEFICGIYGCRHAEAAEKARRIMEQMDLDALASAKARTLSGGWQRRLSIAMALITDPEILFLDEPTLGLDVLARRELWQVIEALKGGTTIVLTTHYLEEAEALADRIGIMAGGRLAACGTAEELMEKTGCGRFEDAFIALCKGGDRL